MILVILTIIGIASSSNTVFELQIVRNEAMYRRNFYRAESAIVEAGQRLVGLARIESIEEEDA